MTARPALVVDHLSADLPAMSWRPLRLSDLPALQVLASAADAADGERFPASLVELKHDLSMPSSDLERDTIAAEAGDGRLLAFGRLESRTGPMWNRVHVHGHVHPEVRGRGLGRTVMGWAERAAGLTYRARAAELDASLPHVLTVHAADAAVSRARLHERCGFSVARVFTDMLRSLDEPIPAAHLPDGYGFVGWSRELDSAFRDAHNAAFRDAWAASVQDAESWRHEFAEDPDFRGDLSLGVMSDDGLVGYVMVGAWDGLADDAGRQIAWLAFVGVRREHRGRGLAGAAIAHTLRAIREAGYATAGLDVDTENAGGALRLYEGLGFRTVKRMVLRAKTLAPGSGR